jgi:hypothetical protein
MYSKREKKKTANLANGLQENFREVNEVYSVNKRGCR